MNSVSSNAVKRSMPTYVEGTVTFPEQTLENIATAIKTVPIIAGAYYTGRIDLDSAPTADISFAYNDYSGMFSDAERTTAATEHVVLYPIGKTGSDTLRILLSNYTGNTITLPNTTVRYCLAYQIL